MGRDLGSSTTCGFSLSIVEDRTREARKSVRYSKLYGLRNHRIEILRIHGQLPFDLVSNGMNLTQQC